MRRNEFLKCAGAAIGALSVLPLLTACGGSSSGGAAVLSAEEIDGLEFMREEEKLAHDVYVLLGALWSSETVFSNIAASETSHTEAILGLLVKYGIPDPAAGNPAGVFTDPDLQALYNTLVVQGQASALQALRVGALIEETDIRDINAKKAVTDEPDILSVYDSLLCGSRNHLRAFDARLDQLGSPYAAQVISQTEWDAIADSPSETCSG